MSRVETKITQHAKNHENFNTRGKLSEIPKMR